jgi:hypothetical protein
VPELHDLLADAAPRSVRPPDLDAVRRTVRQRRRARTGGRLAGAALLVAGVVSIAVATTSASTSNGDDGPVDVGPGPTVDVGPPTIGAPDGSAGPAEAPTPISPSPLSPRTAPAAVWTGDEVVIWGGVGADGSPVADGAAWNPDTDTWRVLPPSPSPAPIAGGVTRAVWTGEWVVLATQSLDGVAFAVYDPVADRWGDGNGSMTAPQLESFGMAAVGDSALVWGGPDTSGPVAWWIRPDPFGMVAVGGGGTATSAAQGTWVDGELITWLGGDEAAELSALSASVPPTESLPSSSVWRPIATDVPVPVGPAVAIGRTLVVLDCLEAEPCTEHNVDLDTGAVTSERTPLTSVVRLEAHGSAVLAVANAPYLLAVRDATGTWSQVGPVESVSCCAAVVLDDDELVVWGGRVGGVASAAGWRQPWPPAGTAPTTVDTSAPRASTPPTVATTIPAAETTAAPALFDAALASGSRSATVELADGTSASITVSGDTRQLGGAVCTYISGFGEAGGSCQEEFDGWQLSAAVTDDVAYIRGIVPVGTGAVRVTCAGMVDGEVGPLTSDEEVATIVVPELGVELVAATCPVDPGPSPRLVFDVQPVAG